ncbi:SRPBCC family protein [Hymenobacter busanensis]|uniref:SRPBCC family protein n=1 Tax=Hymenobacter busanensis TaxID=2607656 RepID=A0A7L4ZYV6_9BACT|nr:SRPBCC family protein [Hymenobacter busanensis]KAA9333200.1 SRPBCC family protein [Hymenobacter busanensis]QHJ08123.1 hypothetical protein GUY19_12845 [Hymenobacter busanensis]
MPYRIEHSVTVDAPIEFVWDIIQNPDLRTSWDARVTSARFLDPAAPFGKGKQMEVVIDLGAFPIVSQLEYLSWKPPYRSSMRTINRDAFRSATTGSWQLAEEHSGRTTWTTKLVFSAALPLVGPFIERWFGGYFDKLTKQSQQQFKTFVEAEWKAQRVLITA